MFDVYNLARIGECFKVRQPLYFMQNTSHYLWPNWVDFLKQKKDIRFVTYGTLIDKNSIQKTVTLSSHIGPVVAHGVRRVFNFALIDENYGDQGGRYQRSPKRSHSSTLNILHTGNVKDKVNGILLSTFPGELDALAEREYGYDIIPVEYRGSNKNGTAYMFIARKSQEIGYRVRDDILPNESALTLCLTGASTYGREFLEMWINSCYLADGTALADHPYYKSFIDDFLISID